MVEVSTLRIPIELGGTWTPGINKSAYHSSNHFVIIPGIYGSGGVGGDIWGLAGLTMPFLDMAPLVLEAVAEVVVLLMRLLRLKHLQTQGVEVIVLH